MTDVMPVVTLDGAPVAAGRPGPIKLALREAFEARLYAGAGFRSDDGPAPSTVR